MERMRGGKKTNYIIATICDDLIRYEKQRTSSLTSWMERDWICWMLDRHNEHCNTTDMLVMLELRSEKPQMNTGVLPGLNIYFGVVSLIALLRCPLL